MTETGLGLWAHILARLFISHSSANDAAARALCQWLSEQGFDDVFLDIDPNRGLVAGQRWQEALKAAADRCEAVLFLVSSAWLASKWCLAEFLLAKTLHKRIFGLIIEPVPLERIPVEMTAEWQLCQLIGDDPIRKFDVPIDGKHENIAFREAGLDLLRRGLERAGLDANSFPWPPPGDPKRAPYRGLRALDTSDAAIFFGRDAAIVRALDRIRGFAESGIERAFVILGASGSGKSSFLRAGLWPRLARDDVSFLPLPIIRPQAAVITGNSGLAASLAITFERLGSARPPGRIKDALNRGPVGLGALLDELSEMAKRRLVGLEASKDPTIVFPVDQAEELFTADGAREAGPFLQMLADLLLADSPARHFLALVTIRSDRYELLQAEPHLRPLKQELFNLPSIPPTEFKTIIEGPAKRVVETGGRLTIDPALTERLIVDAQGANSLPLLAFTLERLYADYGSEGKLTIAEYEKLGGVQGSIGEAIARSLSEPDRPPQIPAAQEDQLECLRTVFIPRLARVDRKTGAPMRRVCKINDFSATARAMVERLIEARVLLVDQRVGVNVVEVAHESLLRRWPPLTAWLEAEAENLKLLDELADAAADWAKNGKLDSWLDHRAERLYLAEMLVAREEFRDLLGNDGIDYIVACRSRECPAFRERGKDLLPLGLDRAGLDAKTFSWPPPDTPDRAPYRGLRVIDVQDAAIFFGRDADIVRALERIRQLVESRAGNLFLVLGGSGVGKSSFLRAGLWPRLERSSADFIPLQVIRAQQNDPDVAYLDLVGAIVEAFDRHGVTCRSDAVQMALANGPIGIARIADELIDVARSRLDPNRSDPTIIIPIDQLERLFVDNYQSSTNMRDFLTTVLTSPEFTARRRILVIGTVRSDLYPLLERNAAISLTEQDLFNLPPLAPAQLHEAISRPAGVVAARFESDDVAHRLLVDGEQEANPLPLLACVLETMWIQMVARGDGILRAPAEELWAAISDRAESFLAQHSTSEDRIRRLFIPALVALREDGKPIRQIARRTELTEEQWQLASELANDPYRLLVIGSDKTGNTFVEVAHETIFQSWPRFRSWLDDERTFLAWLTGMETACRTWQAEPAHSKDQALLVGLPLAQAEDRLASPAGEVSADVRQYVQVSVQLRERAASRRRAIVVTSSIVFALISAAAGIGAVFAFHQRDLAIAEKQRAQVERAMAVKAQESATIANLRTASVISPDGARLLVLDPTGRVRVIDLASDRELGVISVDGSITSAAFSPDGTRIATAADDKTARIWDAKTLQQIAVLLGAKDTIRRVAFSPDGALLAAGGDDNAAHVWSLQTGQELYVIRASAPVITLAFNPDGKRLLVSTADGTFYSVDTATGNVAAVGIRG